MVPSGLSLPPEPCAGGSRVTAKGHEVQCSDPRSSPTVRMDTQLHNTRPCWTHRQLWQKHLTPRNSATRDRLFSKPESISSLNLYYFQFWLQEPPSMQTLHLCIPCVLLCTIPQIWFSWDFHEQNLYCLGISAVYFGRDISIYISHTRSSVRSHIDFSLQAYIYIYLMKNSLMSPKIV